MNFRNLIDVKKIRSKNFQLYSLDKNQSILASTRKNEIKWVPSIFISYLFYVFFRL